MNENNRGGESEFQRQQRREQEAIEEANKKRKISSELREGTSAEPQNTHREQYWEVSSPTNS